jgi:hypothetical protein
MPNIGQIKQAFIDTASTALETAQDKAKALQGKAQEALDGLSSRSQGMRAAAPRQALGALGQKLGAIKEDMKAFGQYLKHGDASEASVTQAVKQDVQAFGQDMKAFGQYLKQGDTPKAGEAAQPQAKLHVGTPPARQERRQKPMPAKVHVGPAPQYQPRRNTQPAKAPQPLNVGANMHMGAAPAFQPRRNNLQANAPANQAAMPQQPAQDWGFRPMARPAEHHPAAGIMNAGIAGQYEKINLKITDDTRPTFTDGNLLGQPEKLGSGAFNTVFSVTLAKPPDNKTFDGVFKPLGNQEHGWVAVTTGVPPNDPQIAMRNLATCDYAKALGFDVVPETRIATISTGDGSGPKLGMVMEKAEGRNSEKMNHAALENPEVARETTKLQLLDHLVGQGDRHQANYFIKVAPDGKVKITGIDNDQCFGAKLTDPNGIAWKGTDDCGFRGTTMPPVVDTEMAKAINDLTPDKLSAMLGDKLSQAEVGAAIQRLDGVKAHIAGLEAKGLVIDPGNWGSAMKHMTPDNSYAARDYQYSQGW